ncbi:LysE family translocator [Aliikangiella maris]|uniref:LysE family translocator n=2 Tax=Aliikangiella maris TaxID=3162458 RepID=A0ABV2BUV2_9GAMM
MISEQIISLITFASIASVTPGPNNIMLMSSGMLFGLRKTLPHILGVVLGFSSMLTAAVFGIAQLLFVVPGLIWGIKLLGVCWLIWLSLQYFKAAMASTDDNNTESKKMRSRPFLFIEAFAFQWANPKGILAAISCAGAFVSVSNQASERALIIVSVFLIVGIMTCFLWTMVGNVLMQFMAKGPYVKLLNICMGILILLTAAGVVLLV